MQVLKVLSDKTRYDMVRIMLREEREMCICEFGAYLDKDASVLYRNIKKLEEADIVSTHKEGRKLLAGIKNKEAVESIISSAQEIESNLAERAMPEKVTN